MKHIAVQANISRCQPFLYSKGITMPETNLDVFKLIYDNVFKDTIDKSLKSVQETADMHPEQNSAGGSIDFSKDMLVAQRMVVDSDEKYNNAIRAVEEAGIEPYLVYGEINKKITDYILSRIKATDHDFLFVNMDQDFWLTYELVAKKPDEESEYQRLKRVYVALEDAGIDAKINRHYMDVVVKNGDRCVTGAIDKGQLYFDIEDYSNDSVPIDNLKTAKWLGTIVEKVMPFLGE